MQTIRNTLKPVITFIRVDVRRLFRDKVALFFTFLFPLIFLLVFGGLFGRETNISFSVALVNNSNSEFAAQFAEQVRQNELFKVDDTISGPDQAKEKLSRGELDAIITLPEAFGQQGDLPYPSGDLRVLYDQTNAQGAQTLIAVLQSVFQDINSQFVDTSVPFTISSESTAVQGATNFDYIFAGLLGFSVLSLGVFGPTSVFPKLKQRGVLRRYKTTPLQVWQYFLGNVLSNALYGILSVATMFIAAMVLYDLKMQGNYVLLLGFVVLSASVLFGIGLAVGGWAKNENQAAPLANLITFPMMFLSGTFFPRFIMPEWLQSVSGYLPLTPVIDGARMIITEGRGLIDILPQVGLLCGWLVIIYVIAFRVFRWE